MENKKNIPYLLISFLVLFIVIFAYLFMISNDMSMAELEREAMKDARNYIFLKKHIDTH